MELTDRKALEYRLGAPPERTPEDVIRARAEGITGLRFTRLAHRAPDTGDTAGGVLAVIEVERGEHVERLAHRIVYRSPTGLEFGYMGSGPHDTAVNVLGLLLEPREAVRLAQRFKEDVVARIPQEEGGAVSFAYVVGWVLEAYRAETSDPVRMRSEEVARLGEDTIAAADALAALEERADDRKGKRQGKLTAAEATEAAELRARIERNEARERELREAAATEGVSVHPWLP